MHYGRLVYSFVCLFVCIINDLDNNSGDKKYMHRRSKEEFFLHFLERFSFCFVLRSVISYLIVEMHVFVCRFVVQDLDSKLIGFRFVCHFTKADFMIVVYCLLLIHS